MEQTDTILLAGLLRSDVPTLISTCDKYLRNLYKESTVYSCDEYVFAVGDIPILLVAHLDTVWLEAPVILVTEDKAIWTGKNGLGADDRAGVFAILKLIQQNKHKPYVLFTTDEEMGGIGAYVFSKDFPAPPEELKYIIEIDRRGQGQSVFYNCKNKEFENYVNSFGFTTHEGIFSDISFICPTWNIAGVNLSAGYYNEHTPYEYLKIKDLYYTIDKVQEMLNDVDNAKNYIYLKESNNNGKRKYRKEQRRTKNY